MLHQSKMLKNTCCFIRYLHLIFKIIKNNIIIPKCLPKGKRITAICFINNQYRLKIVKIVEHHFNTAIVDASDYKA